MGCGGSVAASTKEDVQINKRKIVSNIKVSTINAIYNVSPEDLEKAYIINPSSPINANDWIISVNGEQIEYNKDYKLPSAENYEVKLELKEGIILSDISYYFKDCITLTEIDFCSFIFKNINNITGIFMNCNKLVSIKGLSESSTSNVTNLNKVFSGCSALKDISDISNWNMTNIVSTKSLFKNTSFSSFNQLSNWDMSKVKDISEMFEGCINLTSTDFAINWNISSVVKMNSTFKNCVNLSNIKGLKDWNTEGVKEMCSLFEGCKSLININEIREWNTSCLEIISFILKGCVNLESIEALIKWKKKKLMYYNSTFDECNKINKTEIEDFYNDV